MIFGSIKGCIRAIIEGERQDRTSKEEYGVEGIYILERQHRRNVEHDFKSIAKFAINRVGTFVWI